MQLNPQEIVQELDKYIIGQNDAKKSVAIALRNRWRRQQIEEPMRSEITPKNILMIGPTGVGKTEIARRLAKLSNAPFIKIEATKFTEVGYVGKDVESIIRDLIEIEIKNRRKAAKLANYEAAKEKAIEKILEILVPNTDSENTTKQKFKEKLLSGELDDTEIEVDIAVTKPQVGIMMPPALEEMTTQLQSIFEFSMEKRKKTVKMPIKNALKTFIDEESHSLINEEDIKQQSIINTEQNGIVFIDEIDKVAIKSSGSSNSEISRAGVQRDLLPLVEGTTVNTKYGMIKTDHILFIASGAFHISKPSDLLPELQLEAAVASSTATAERLKKLGIEVVDMNSVGGLDAYVDGADEIDRHMHMIKGGGAALTREKIVASIAKKFVCIVDDSKWVEQLGRDFPLPIEVIPMARSAVARKIVALGGDPVYREGVVTDNGNVILDVFNLNILNALELEKTINNIPGVVTNGIFALNAATIAIVATNNGIEERTAQ